MALFLVQHGKSLPKEKDPDRGLSRQGIEETRAMAGVAQKQNVQVLRIIHSGKKRGSSDCRDFHENAGAGRRYCQEPRSCAIR